MHRSAVNPDTLIVPLRPHLPEGWYLVYWRAISVDGHPVEGAFAFAIGAGGLVCRSCRAPGAATPATATVMLMSALMRGDWAHADHSERRHQAECSGLVAAYLQWHLEHAIRSLRHVEHA